MKLTIEGAGLVARGGAYRVLIGDADITNALVSLELRIGDDEINTATIRIAPDEIEVNAEALAALTAQIPESNPSEVSQSRQ